MISQIGQFFLVIGIITVVIFMATIQAQQPVYGLFCVGLPILVFGLFLIWKGRKPTEHIEHFSTLRKLGKKSSNKEKKG